LDLRLGDILGHQVVDERSGQDHDAVRSPIGGALETARERDHDTTLVDESGRRRAVGQQVVEPQDPGGAS
jgi:hypothetical protein